MLYFRIRIISNSKNQTFSNFERDSIRLLVKPEFRMRFGSKFRPESRILRIRMDNPNKYMLFILYKMYILNKISICCNVLYICVWSLSKNFLILEKPLKDVKIEIKIF